MASSGSHQIPLFPSLLFLFLREKPPNPVTGPFLFMQSIHHFHCCTLSPELFKGVGFECTIIFKASTRGCPLRYQVSERECTSMPFLLFPFSSNILFVFYESLGPENLVNSPLGPYLSFSTFSHPSHHFISSIYNFQFPLPMPLP